MTLIKEKLTQDLKNSMRAKDTTRLETVRSINGAIVNFEKANPGKDVDYSKVLKQLENQRKQAIEGFTAGANGPGVIKETCELEIIREYINEFLPKQLGELETIMAIEALMEDMKVETKDVKANTGRIMGELKKKFGTSIDMQKASAIIKSLA